MRNIFILLVLLLSNIVIYSQNMSFIGKEYSQGSYVVTAIKFINDSIVHYSYGGDLISHTCYEGTYKVKNNKIYFDLILLINDGYEEQINGDFAIIRKRNAKNKDSIDLLFYFLETNVSISDTTLLIPFSIKSFIVKNEGNIIYDSLKYPNNFELKRINDYYNINVVYGDGGEYTFLLFGMYDYQIRLYHPSNWEKEERLQFSMEYDKNADTLTDDEDRVYEQVKW